MNRSPQNFQRVYGAVIHLSAKPSKFKPALIANIGRLLSCRKGVVSQKQLRENHLANPGNSKENASKSAQLWGSQQLGEFTKVSKT